MHAKHRAIDAYVPQPARAKHRNSLWIEREMAVPILRWRSMMTSTLLPSSHRLSSCALLRSALALTLACWRLTTTRLRALPVPERPSPTIVRPSVPWRKARPVRDPGRRASRRLSRARVIYLVFNEGYTAMRVDDWIDQRSVRMRSVSGVSCRARSQEPESTACRLMEIRVKRRAPASAIGRAHPVLDHNALWDQLSPSVWPRSSVSKSSVALGRYGFAGRSACHARRVPRRDGLADRGALRSARQLAPSPVVELNRRSAHRMAFVPGGLTLRCPDLGALTENYHLLPACAIPRKLAARRAAQVEPGLSSRQRPRARVRSSAPGHAQQFTPSDQADETCDANESGEILLDSRLTRLQ